MFSSQSKINPLSVPQKPTTLFENPLTRTEISSPLDHLMIPLSKNGVAPISVSLTASKPPVVIEKNNNTPVTIQPTTRKRLPDEIKAIFENNSQDFTNYARKEEKNTERGTPVLTKTTEKMDEWDKALLLGEYPSVPEEKKLKRLSFPTPVFLPQETAVHQINIIPQVVETKDKEDAGIIATVKKPFIPTKPKQQSELNTAAPHINITSTPIPQKPLGVFVAQTVPKKTSVNQVVNKNQGIPLPNMSETLVDKIIEGQMRGVFENAPPLLQKKLEKTVAQDILSGVNEKTPEGSIENEVWKKRLREYLVKLSQQTMPTFSDANTMNPTEGELVLDYVKRVYPVLLKAQIINQ